jgi:acyl carrier protein
MKIVDRVIEFLKENNGLEAVDIQSNSKLVAELGLTSYDVVEMCCQLEAMFEIEIDENEITTIETVGDIVQYIETKQQVVQSHESVN